IFNSTEDFHGPHKNDPIFSTGQTSSDECRFFVKDDTEPEGDEIYAVHLGLIPGNAVIDVAYIKILANDDGNGVVGFGVPNGISVQEPRTAGGVAEKLPMRRSIGTFGAISVQWRVASSVANNDVTPTFGVVEFQTGENVKNLEFFVRPDLLIEQDENFEFELTSVSGGARLNTTLSKVLVRILANDIPVRFALSHIIVLENQTNVAVWIYRGLDTSGTNIVASIDRTSSAVWYLQSDGAVGNQDFHQASGTMVFGNRETRKMINVTIIDDSSPEKSENFTVHLTNLSADVTLVSPSECTIQILHSDDHVGVFGLSGDGNITVNEDGGSNLVEININRTAGAFGMVNLTWMVTSSQGGDLSNQISPLHGAVTFSDGERQKMVNINVTDDMVPEEAFWFVVELTSTNGGRITNDPSRRSQKVIIRDSDDVYGVFELSNGTYQILSLTSRPRMVNFAISRSGGNLGTVSVGYLVTYHAVDGSEHTTSIGIQRSGTILFSSGQSNAAISLNISREGFIRANSVFWIRLTSVKLVRPENTLVPPTTPRFGPRTSANLTVHPQYADGEIGFEEVSVTVTEPENGRPKEINLAVFRDGTLYRASLMWSIIGVKTSQDLNPTSGSLVFET
ncbi:G- coupled receptor 98-like, partial [Paramuricea clavata]